jgi:hypothetical protein
VDTRTRLARLLGMMGSQHDGGRSTRHGWQKLVREQGITWFDVIGTAPPRASPDPPPPPRRSYDEAQFDDLDGQDDDDVLHRFESASDACDFVLRSTPLLTDWERTFVLRLPGFTKLSHKQLDILRRLVMHAIAAGATP